MAPASELDDLIEKQPMRAGRPVAWAVMIMLTAGVVFAYFTPLVEVAIAPGEVVPQSQVRSVQHLEGGVVLEIFVQDGKVVAEGERLIQVELSASELNLDEVLATLDAFLLSRARLIAESRDEAPNWPRDVVVRQPDIAKAEVLTYEMRRAEIETSIAVLGQQSNQRRLEIGEYRTQLASLEAELSLANETLTTNQTLLRDALVTRVELLESEREVEQLQGQIATISLSIPRAQAALTEADNRIEETRLQFRREVQVQLGETEVSIARAQEQMAEATRQQERATLTSPIAGVIKDLAVQSVGDVVRAGDVIMQVVPIADRLVVEARLQPDDLGFVVVGMPVTVKVTAFEFSLFGGLDGTVTYIAPDINEDDEGKVYTLVIIETDRSYLGTAENPRQITAGMQATAEILTGTRSVLQYLIRPIQKAQEGAFKER